MPTSSTVLQGLNPAQLEAVDTLDGPLLVMAGAGTGKTRVITRRIARLIECGVSPEKILAVTFTNKAAREMSHRVYQLIGRRGPLVATFHGFGARFLREESHHYGRSSDFTLFDRADTQSAIKSILKNLGLDASAFPAATLMEMISSAKTAGITPEEDISRAASDWEAEVARVYRNYESFLAANDAFDFDDLITLPTALLGREKEVHQRYLERFSHILVDEYQDVNTLQDQLGTLLAGPAANLCVTGDPDQCIYSWRGADIRFILSFKERFPQARVIALEQNYRSTNTILKAASAVIRFNSKRQDKVLWSENGEGQPITILRVSDEVEEARRTAERIQSLRRQGVRLNDIAIFYRLNSLSLPLERALLSEGIPYTVLRGVEFFKRREVKDLIAWLRYLNNPHDTVSLKRIINTPPRGIGEKTWTRLESLAREAMTTPGEVLRKRELLSKSFTARARSALERFSALEDDLRQENQSRIADLMRHIIEVTGLESHLQKQAQSTGQDPWGNLQQLISHAREFQTVRCDATITQFLEEVALFTDSDTPRGEQDKVCLMTIHCAKGLEFPHCIVVGMDEGIFPHKGPQGDADEEEERRLFYVALTRAMKSCLLLTCLQRNRFGRSEFARPSLFLTEIPAELTEADDETGASEPHDDREIEYEMDDSFHIARGARVQHTTFGPGTVTRIQGRGGHARVMVQFDSGDQKKLILKYAGLTALDSWD